MYQTQTKNSLYEYRCTCGKLLCKGNLIKGVVEIKCRHCREIMKFSEIGQLSVPI